MQQRDNWGSAARIGLFIVGNEAVPEAEWWAMLPANVSVHAARVMAPAPWARWNADRSTLVLAGDFARGCEHFAAMRLDAVIVGHSSSSILGGPGWDEAVVGHLAGLMGAGSRVTTNGIDCLAALRALAVQRPFLVFPPWYSQAVVSAGVDYFAVRGVAPAGHLHYDPGEPWRAMRPDELYPNGMGFAQEIEPLYAQIRAACPDAADGVLIAGTGFRCVGIIDALEQALGRPVISANQASLWQCLRLAGVRAPVGSYGRLLRQ